MSVGTSFHPVAKEYDPLKAGSIDGTDTEPHDHGIVRALKAKYKPNKGVQGDPNCTVFVGRLNHSTTEENLSEIFAKFGNIVRLQLVRDLVTGFHKGYAFVEYGSSTAAYKAMIETNKTVVNDREILVEMECERTLKGWVPRRLGGGLSGRRESGQLRFGGRERPFRKPIILPSREQDSSVRNSEQENGVKWDKRIERSPLRRPRSRSRSRERNYKETQRDRESSRRDRDRHRSRDERERRRDKYYKDERTGRY